MNHDPRTMSRRSFSAGSFALVATAIGIQTTRGAAAPPVEIIPERVAEPDSYIAYIETACKSGPFYTYTCEFDASWAVLKTFGINAPLEEQLQRIEIDTRIEPYLVQEARGNVIYGGDITTKYSGNYMNSFLARTTGPVMRKVFQSYGLRTVRVHTRDRVEDHLRVGRLIWIKTTVDFRDWVPATWVTPEGKELQVVTSNDHAMIVIGYNDDVVVIRDVLGPTDTNWQRPYEFEVPWDLFLRCWGAQGSDGLAVGP